MPLAREGKSLSTDGLGPRILTVIPIVIYGFDIQTSPGVDGAIVFRDGDEFGEEKIRISLSDESWPPHETDHSRYIECGKNGISFPNGVHLEWPDEVSITTFYEDL